MGGGDNKIEETPQQKAFADVARQKWSQYQRDFRPAEDRFMRDVDKFNAPAAYDQAANMASVPVESQFSQAVQQQAQGLVQNRVNPQSGLFQEEINKLDRKKEMTKADYQNQAQVSQQDRYTGGLQNIVRMGQGQSTEAMQGMGQIAGMANQRAQNDAQNSQQNRFGNQQVVGGLAGAGARYGLQQSAPKQEPGQG